ncbi:tetratricopeptide repeat protein [candidate division FCPU426 bacterium]|nr:tetratricopeptide repeat protein [candidate division FCPU426 bacterium]
MLLKRTGGFVLMVLVCLGTAARGEKTAPPTTVDASKPRLVMVQVPSWKTIFFGLPQELPLLLQAGENFENKSKHYDFTEGMRAMEVFITMRPKDKQSAAYQRFIKKWPVYQDFFQAVDQEQYPKAADLLNQVLKLDPHEPAVHFYWGSLNTHLKKYAKAEENYKTCLKYYPKYGPAYINLARLAKARGASAEARQFLQEAVRRLADGEQADALRIAEKMLESLDQ